MRIYIDKVTGRFVLSEKFNSSISLFEFKRGDTARIEIAYVTDGSIVQLDGTTSIMFGIKEAGKFDGDYVVSESDFTYNVTTGFYEGSPNFNTTELNDLLNANDGDDTNDIASVDCLFEITATDDNGIFSSATSTARIYHDVNKGTEGVPTDAEPAYPTSTTLFNHLGATAGNPHEVTISEAIDSGGGIASGDVSFVGELMSYGNDLSFGKHVINVEQADARFLALNASSLTEYADDAAAGVGGLVAGDLYTTTGTLKIKL